ncbi:MAG TPA: sigma factor-like helix-turn-helix DNA-binding protein, partial [Candidatus Polarisedimenticolaceae bacterium]|nr:sigma factor-like helix-turn-helix DNA-binding protein [Candidatus Polarisedimenticolaceae bacterium]
LDAPAGDDRQPVAERLPDPTAGDVEDDVARRELQRQVETALEAFRKELGDRDALLLDQRILSEDPLSLQEIGDRFGTTREAVRQAEVRLMKRLSDYLKRELGDLGPIRIGPR